MFDKGLSGLDSLTGPQGYQTEGCDRETDRVAQQRTGRWPLSVSTDRIGVTALRAAVLLGKLSSPERPVDRTGRGKVVEVYPAAALWQWRLPASGYKGKDRREERVKLVSQLLDKVPWLSLSGELRDQCENNDNALDALVAALVTRAAACGFCEPVPAEALPLAEKEGWIALPRTDSLERLAEAGDN